MRILNKPFTKNRFKTNIECVFKHSVVRSALKHPFFYKKFSVKNAYPQEVMKKITPWGGICSDYKNVLNKEEGIGEGDSYQMMKIHNLSNFIPKPAELKLCQVLFRF